MDRATRHLLHELAGALVVVALAAAFEGCGLGDGGVSCDDSHGPAGATDGTAGACAGPRSRWVCVGGEGSHEWLQEDCPGLGVCQQGSGASSECTAVVNDAGGPCTSIEECKPLLACMGGVCTAPTPQQEAACTSAQPLALVAPTNGVAHEVTATASLEPTPGLFGATFASTGACGGKDAGAEALFRLDVPPTDASLLVVVDGVPPDFAFDVYLRETCLEPRGAAVACAPGSGDTTARGFPMSGGKTYTLFVETARVPTSSLPIVLHASLEQLLPSGSSCTPAGQLCGFTCASGAALCFGGVCNSSAKCP